MIFDELDAKMRTYEQSLDQVLLPDMYMVARLDGRGFTKLTKEVCKFEAPFDERFRDMMVNTTKTLMDCGFRVVYAFTESDEISLLFLLESEDFGRKTRKLNSILAGEASAKFSLLYGKLGVFDCRISELPQKENVVDYFRWRNEDANRNALNAWCYWTLRKEGQNKVQATKTIEGLSTADKNELLFKRGINYNDLPLWQKRGVGFYWKAIERNGAERRELVTDMELPMGSEYGDFIKTML